MKLEANDGLVAEEMIGLARPTSAYAELDALLDILREPLGRSPLLALPSDLLGADGRAITAQHNRPPPGHLAIKRALTTRSSPRASLHLHLEPPPPPHSALHDFRTPRERRGASAATAIATGLLRPLPRDPPRGPPPHSPFSIDVRVLRREFLQLQGRAHPDLHAAEHKARAQATSAHLNEAFRTLAHPLLRAQYLLSLRGIDVASDEAAKVADMELLAEVMEAREEIEDAHAEADLEGPKAVNDERIAASEEVLERAFAADDLEAAKREAVRLRYWTNIKQCLDDWEPGKRVELQH
ncbi:unnamed protein product [Parascedosporium putredinis]|uniref:Co-chaperone HscB C-terminal oligomerisation domain-containing protein n=1 Tax=Parascedosporium putredinis TaxID=1442378 RepID=A0A9P1MCI7_9PEZI|nr:unnamed protein product [Parascedosporium putredinis]CAI7997920.1 unnamed protein product [Parascedosporium putredinis]